MGRDLEFLLPEELSMIFWLLLLMDLNNGCRWRNIAARIVCSKHLVYVFFL
jgi:hypothetical protein